MVLHPAAYPEQYDMSLTPSVFVSRLYPRFKAELLSMEQNKDAPILPKESIGFFVGECDSAVAIRVD
jgi:hypothetical protein